MSTKTPVIRRIPRAEVERTIDITAQVTNKPLPLEESVKNWVRESRLNIDLERQREEDTFFGRQ